MRPALTLRPVGDLAVSALRPPTGRPSEGVAGLFDLRQPGSWIPSAGPLRHGTSGPVNAPTLVWRQRSADWPRITICKSCLRFAAFLYAERPFDPARFLLVSCVVCF